VRIAGGGRTSRLTMALVAAAGAASAGVAGAAGPTPAAPPAAAPAAPAAPGPAAPARAASPSSTGALTMEEAVSIALSRNRDVIAAKMEIEAAELDVVAARVYPNPILAYSVGNVVLGSANDQMGALRRDPGAFGQLVHAVGIDEILDVWSKRSARTRAAERGVAQRRYLTEDALRAIVHAVRSAFADVLRAQSERDMAREIAARYADTARLSAARFRAGDIAEAELRRIELEGLRFNNAVIDAELQVDLGRQRLAALLGLGASAAALPGERLVEPEGRPTFDLPRLVQRALEQRPDLKAAGAARIVGEAQLTAAEREVYPDLTLGATYTHSAFTISGDNPNALALSLSMPLPLFDRNQANIGRARLDMRRAENDVARLRLGVEADVTGAVRRSERARTLLASFEKPAVPGGGPHDGTGDPGGLLARAESALRVAERSYKAGAISLLEMLDAQRTYLDTRGQYLRALDDFRQAAIDVTNALGD